jgi:S-adenosylmethionine synthetase
VARPVSLNVESFGTGKVPDEILRGLIEKHLDLRPHAIISRFKLQRPIYRQTAAYGHFGRPDLDLPWERLDYAETFAKEAGIAPPITAG